MSIVHENRTAVAQRWRTTSAAADFFLRGTVNAEIVSGNSGKNSGRIKNLRPWKKGQSGNPLGRPKKTLIADALRAKLAEIDPNDPDGRTNAEIIADRMIARAKQKDRGQQDAAEIADRTEGKPRQQVSASDGIAVEPPTAEELAGRIRSLLERAAQRRALQSNVR